MKKREVVLKKPQASLLTAYNQSWKPAPNHFMRHSDVRVRNDDRRANVMDLANQPKVSQRIGGWKTHLISAEIDEVVSYTIIFVCEIFYRLDIEKRCFATIFFPL